MGGQVVHKQPKEYRKKKRTSTKVIDSQDMIINSSTGNLTTTIFEGTEAGKQLGQLD